MDAVFYGDCLVNLRSLAALGVRVQTCVTSPPYFGLRSYLPDSHEDKALEIGLEETPEQFIAALVGVFRAVRDVLADDGTLWINIGDSYARNASKGGSGPGGKNEAYSDSYGLAKGHARAQDAARQSGVNSRGVRPKTGARMWLGEEIKEKDLIGIPWMLAFALRADGWYLRQDIIWHKPNPMPESVTDRCTKAHEYVFLLSKSPKYFYDTEAVKEPVSGGAHPRGNGVNPKAAANAAGNKQNSSFSAAISGGLVEHRNKRSVWHVATRPYKGAHFATFPPALIEPCILAGSRPGDIVLDPFMGSGTTAATAKKMGRQYIGCELNADNAPLIAERLANA